MKNLLQFCFIYYKIEKVTDQIVLILQKAFFKHALKRKMWMKRAAGTGL